MGMVHYISNIFRACSALPDARPVSPSWPNRSPTFPLMVDDHYRLITETLRRREDIAKSRECKCLQVYRLWICVFCSSMSGVRSVQSVSTP